MIHDRYVLTDRPFLSIFLRIGPTIYSDMTVKQILRVYIKWLEEYGEKYIQE